MSSAYEKSDLCRRVEYCVERRENGQAITETDRQSVRDHARNCPLCRIELDALELLSDRSEGGALGPIDELSRRRIIDEAIFRRQMDAAEETPIRHRLRRPALVVGMGLAGLAAAAAAVLILAVVGPRQESVESKSELAKIDRVAAPKNIGVFKETRGKITQDGVPIEAGDVVNSNGSIRANSGDAVLELQSGIRIWLQTDADLSVALTRDDSVQVELRRGTIWNEVNPDREDPSLRVVTSAGAVKVVGTVFRVRALGSTVDTDVLRGSVRIEPRNAAPFTVQTGYRAELSTGERRALTILETRDYEQQLQERSLLKYHQLPAETVREEREVTSLEPKAAKNGPPALSTGTLLAQVRLLRREQDWVGVAHTYEKLIKRHWGSDAANASMVALGELRVDKLSDPAGGLGWFESYLDTGAEELAAEALFGKARALRALGDLDRERKTLNELTTRFPKAIQANAARRRLHEIWDRQNSE